MTGRSTYEKPLLPAQTLSVIGNIELVSPRPLPARQFAVPSSQPIPPPSAPNSTTCRTKRGIAAYATTISTVAARATRTDLPLKPPALPSTRRRGAATPVVWATPALPSATTMASPRWSRYTDTVNYNNTPTFPGLSAGNTQSDEQHLGGVDSKLSHPQHRHKGQHAAHGYGDCSQRRADATVANLTASRT